MNAAKNIPSDEHISLTLFDIDVGMCAAWATAFAGWPEVTIIQSALADMGELEAVVAAGNSYAIMDGALDLVMAQQWPGCAQAVSKVVCDELGGYVPVGNAVVAEPAHDGQPVMVYTPTMRIPLTLHSHEQLDIYDAFWAALWALHLHDKNRHWQLACPGLGTGVGQMDPNVTASLMALAWRHWRGRNAATTGAGTARMRDLTMLKSLD